MEILSNKFKHENIDLAYAFEEAARASIEKIIQRKKNLKGYYILCFARWDAHGCVVRMSFSLTSVKPPAMIGTVCYFRDNVKDQLTRLWVLPRDLPLPDGKVLEGTGEDHIIDDAWRLGMPIIH